MNGCKQVRISILRSSIHFVAVSFLSSSLATYGQTSRHTLHVTSPRPVAEAVRSLTSEHSMVVTYEDPRYEYEGDVRDVTDIARSPEKRNAPGPRVKAPRSRAIDVSYVSDARSGAPVDWGETLRAIVVANQASGSGGRFRVEQSGKAFHIVPVGVRNEQGQWVEQRSILDTRLTLAKQELSGSEAIELLIKEVSDQAGIKVTLGTHPMNLFRQSTVTIEARNEPARDVLLRALHGMSERLTWRLLYGPDVKYYGLNIRAVARPPESDVVQPMPGNDGLGPAVLTPEEQDELRRRRAEEDGDD